MSYRMLPKVVVCSACLLTCAAGAQAGSTRQQQQQQEDSSRRVSVTVTSRNDSDLKRTMRQRQKFLRSRVPALAKLEAMRDWQSAVRKAQKDRARSRRSN